MKALFISYNGALEPLMQSQGIPYLKGLSCKGVKYFLLTFEKASRKEKYIKKKINKLKNELEDYNIKWLPLRYHKYPSLPATLFDIFMGTIIGLYLVVSKKIDIIHARATVPAAMGYTISKITGKKFIFDERGLTAEEYIDGGIWKKNSLSYKLTLYFEKKFLIDADGLVILTQNIKDYLENSKYLPLKHKRKKQNIQVIPCCVDIKKFASDSSVTEKLREKFNLSQKFVFLYIGSLGTWYLLDEMIDFFLVAKTLINNAHFLILTHTGKDIVEHSCKRKGLSFADVTIKHVESEKMPEHIKLGHIGMFFIKPVLSKRSSCPTKFAEYLACGLPVVINSGIGDTSTIVEKNKLGVVVRSFRRESYIDSLSKLLELLKEKDLLSDRCNKVAKEVFSLETGVSKYFDIYKKVLLSL